MKLRMMWTGALATGMMMLAMTGAVKAQEEYQYTYGEIVSVDQDSITVSEYDFDTEEAADVRYLVSAATEYDNLSSLEELAVNDPVEIEYVMKDGKKVITFLAKSEDWDDEEDYEVMNDSENSEMAP